MATLPAWRRRLPTMPSGWSATPDGGSVAKERTASGKARALVDRLEHLAERTAKVAAQCRQRISGATPDGATRVVSLHDPDARPIAKGRLGKPVEFGYKAQLVDNEDGVILDHNIEAGNPPDAPMLEPAIQRIEHRTGRAPRAVTADRGYGEQGVEDAIRAAGVRHVVLPRKGRPTVARAKKSNNDERSRRWSDGAPAAKDASAAPNATSASTAPASTDSTAPEPGAGTGIFNHNLVKIAGLLQ